MSDITLEVGKKYRTRHGKDVKIIRRFENPLYFKSDHFTFYNEDGQVRDAPKDFQDRWDIVSDVTEPVTPMLINNGCDS